MIRLSRLADYAVLLMSHFARDSAAIYNAQDVAASCGLPAATVSKILAALSRDGLLDSIRGSKGGYHLALPAEEISAEQIIRAIDGPIALTVCVDQGPDNCEVAAFCPSRANWRKINDAVCDALRAVRLTDLTTTSALFPLPTDAVTSEVVEQGKHRRDRAEV